MPSWLPPGPSCNQKPGNVVVKLDVPYIHQVLDVGGADGNWACGPTSVVMVLAYYGKLDPWSDYVTDQVAMGMVLEPEARLADVQVRESRKVSEAALNFAPYVTNVYTSNGHLYNSLARDPNGNRVAGLYGTICPTGLADWGRMKSVLERHGLETKRIAASWNGITAALKRGHPVIVGTGLTPDGHVLVATGYTAKNQLILNDPYGNRLAPGYGGTEGKDMVYPWNCMRAHAALEVTGEYPPPPRPTRTPTITPTSEATPTSLPTPEPTHTVRTAPTALYLALRTDSRPRTGGLGRMLQIPEDLSAPAQDVAAAVQMEAPALDVHDRAAGLLGLLVLLLVAEGFFAVVAPQLVRRRTTSPTMRRSFVTAPARLRRADRGAMSL